jgi:hypothetical protein
MRAEKLRQNWAFWTSAACPDNLSQSCGSIAEAPFIPLLIWACKLLRKLLSHTLPPPPDILYCYSEPRQKSGAVLAFTQCFGHEGFIEQKSLSKVLERAWTSFFLFFKFKIIFTNKKVTALSKSVKPGK